MRSQRAGLQREFCMHSRLPMLFENIAFVSNHTTMCCINILLTLVTNNSPSVEF